MHGVDLHEADIYATMLGQRPCLLLDESLKGCGARVADVGVIEEGERLLQVIPLLLIAAGREHLQEQPPTACSKYEQHLQYWL